MAEDTLLTPLNFNAAIIGKTLNDAKTGVDIIFGYISGMPPDTAEISEKYNDLAIALMDRGMGQAELDMACQQLSGQVIAADFDILVTKSDLPFDARWYLIGDLQSLIQASETEEVTLPFSDFMRKDVINHLSTYGGI